MTPHVELALTHVKNTAGADRGQDRCFTSAQEDTGEYGSIRSRLVKHFRSENSAIGQNDQKRTFRGAIAMSPLTPKADTNWLI
jgi:hypothetical protein